MRMATLGIDLEKNVCSLAGLDEAGTDILRRRMRRHGKRGGPVALGRIRLGGDKAYDVADFVGALGARRTTPHIAVDGHTTKTGKRRKTAIDRRTTRHPGYGVSQRCRQRIEALFAGVKSVAERAKTRFRGQETVDAAFTLALAACNPIRLPRLPEAPT